jgi:hypothetical protein
MKELQEEEEYKLILNPHAIFIQFIKSSVNSHVTFVVVNPCGILMDTNIILTMISL